VTSCELLSNAPATWLRLLRPRAGARDQMGTVYTCGQAMNCLEKISCAQRCQKSVGHT
jgi:hypothetical protein